MKSQPDIKGIYGIRRRANGRIYIGQTRKIGTRFAQHRALLNNNKHSNADLQRDWNEYGEAAFEWLVIEHAPDADEMMLRTLERYHIDKYDAKDPCYGYNGFRRAQGRTTAMTYDPTITDPGDNNPSDEYGGDDEPVDEDKEFGECRIDPDEGTPEPWPPEQGRHLVFATQHTARDIPAMLKHARALFQAGDTSGLALLSDITILAQEYVMSTRICDCGGQLDKAGHCASCEDRRAQVAKILTRYAEEPIYS